MFEQELGEHLELVRSVFTKVLSVQAEPSAAGLEAAIDGAADRGGDADGVALVLGHEDGFDAAAVGGELEEIADGAVGGVETLIDGEASVGKGGAEAVAEVFGEFGGIRSNADPQSVQASGCSGSRVGAPGDSVMINRPAGCRRENSRDVFPHT
jgi:hypothetical protein